MLLPLLISATVNSTPAPVLDLPQTLCAKGTCGECWNTGRKGTISADGIDCDPCPSEFTKPDQTIAQHVPPVNGGPGSSRGSGTRLSFFKPV